MANKNEGLMTFANLPPTLFIHGVFSWTHGTVPSVATLTCVPFVGLAIVGPLSIQYGGLTLLFPECRLLDARYDLQADGTTVMVLSIADRRWKWRFGWIEGRYNIPQPVGDPSQPATWKKPKNEKKPADLAKLCFEAMGEKRYDTSNIPNDTRPEVDWNGVPVEELAKLADLMGCRVTLSPVDNRARLVDLSQGQPIPNLPDFQITGSLDIKQTPVPDSFIFQGARSLFQDDFELEPVGTEPDGEIRPIDKLSYKPKGIGWDYDVPPFFPNVEAKYRKLAEASIFKMWRIKTPVEIEGRKVKGDKKIDELARLLPLEDRQLIRHYVQGQKLIERLPAVVYGDFYAGNETGDQAVKTLKTKHGVKAVFQGGFSIDVERGLVVFSDPVYALTENDGVTASTDPLDSGRIISQAKLWLRTAVGVRNKDTFAWERGTYTFAPSGPKSGTKPFYVTRDDVQLETATIIAPSGVEVTSSNKKEFEAEAKHYLELALREFMLTSPTAGYFAGIIPIAPDGAIQQVTWQINQAGETTTTVSRNREDPQLAPTYRERRYSDTIREILRRESQGTKRKGSK